MKQAGEATEEAKEGAEQAGESGEEIVPAGRVNDKGEVVDDDENVIGKVAEGDKQKLAGSIVSQEGEIVDSEGNVLGKAQPVEGGEEAAGEAKDALEGEAGDKKDAAGEALEGASKAEDPEVPEIEQPELEQPELKGPFKIGDKGEVLDAEGNKIGDLNEQGSKQAKSLIGKDFENIDSEGNIVGEDGNILGKVNLLPAGELPGAEEAKEAADGEKPELKGPFKIGEGGVVFDGQSRKIGDINIEGSQAKSIIGKEFETLDDEGNIVDENGKKVGKVNLLPTDQLPGVEDGETPELPDISILEGLKVNKAGNVVDEDGNVMGKIVEGDPKKLAGKKVGKEGKIWDDQGNQIGLVEVVPEALENQSAPFEDFPDATVDKDGNVTFEGQTIGKIVEGDIQKMIGKKVDADGDVLDKNGNVIGKAERLGPEEQPEPEQIDYSILADKKVNKAGNVVDDEGAVIGRIVEGTLKYLVGKKVDKNGEIWNDSGKVIGKAEPIPDTEKEEYQEPAPFEDFTDATVQANGDVFSGGEKVGVVIEGDAKKLKGKAVDADGDITDKNGNVLGKAERWEAPEEEPEPEVDMSILAGKRVNKAGNVVDKSGDIYGRIVEGDPKALAGKMCDKLGCIRNEGGDVVGKAELVPQSEREGMKEGPFTDFEGCTVQKEGKVVTASGDVVGRLIEGDPKKLFGRAVDDDGDILDKNGNVLGKAERWEEPEVERDVNPMSGRKVNKKGEVVDENGDTIGK